MCVCVCVCVCIIHLGIDSRQVYFLNELLKIICLNMVILIQVFSFSITNYINQESCNVHNLHPTI